MQFRRSTTQPVPRLSNHVLLELLLVLVLVQQDSLGNLEEMHIELKLVDVFLLRWLI